MSTVITSDVNGFSDERTSWAALEEVARKFLDSMQGAGVRSRTLKATVDRVTGADDAPRWKVNATIEIPTR